MKRPFQIRLEKELIEKAKSEAKKQSRSLANLIHHILQQYFK